MIILLLIMDQVILWFKLWVTLLSLPEGKKSFKKSIKNGVLSHAGGG